MIGIPASASRMNAPWRGEDSVRARRPDSVGSNCSPHSPRSPRPRGQSGNTPAQQDISCTPLLLRRLLARPIELPCARQRPVRHTVPERDPRESDDGNAVDEADDTSEVHSGSAVPMVTMTPTVGACRTLRRIWTVSGRAYCSPTKAATNQLPRFSPHASKRRSSRSRSRHATAIDSRASNDLNTTPQQGTSTAHRPASSSAG